MVTELYAYGFLRTIIGIAVIYYLGKFLFKWWLKRKINAAVRQQQNTVSENDIPFQKKEKVRVHIKNEKSETSHNSSGGDYIDYEDVD